MVFDYFELVLVVAAVLIIGIIVALYFDWIVGALFQRPKTGVESLIGKRAVAISEIAPNTLGEVKLDGILWEARLKEGILEPIPKGDEVVVLAVTSLRLVVQKT